MLMIKSLKKTCAAALAALVMSLPMASQALAAPVDMAGLPQQAKVELKSNNGAHRNEVHRPSSNNHRNEVHRSSGNNHRNEVHRSNSNNHRNEVHRSSSNNHRNEVRRPAHHPNVRPHHNPPPRRDGYRDHHHSGTGNFITGAIIGAVIGAVIANNNADY